MAKRPGIQTLRANAFLSQEEFADKMEVSIHTVRSWEAGTNVPRPAKLRTMLEVLGVTREQLLEALETTGRERKERERAAELPAVADEPAMALGDPTPADEPAKQTGRKKGKQG